MKTRKVIDAEYVAWAGRRPVQVNFSAPPYSSKSFEFKQHGNCWSSMSRVDEHLHLPCLDVDKMSDESLGTIIRTYVNLQRLQYDDLEGGAGAVYANGVYIAPAVLLEKELMDLITVVPSSTAGHAHVYIDHPVTWGLYGIYLNQLERGGVLEPGFVGASGKRGWTCTRKPGVKKEQPREEVST